MPEQAAKSVVPPRPQLDKRFFIRMGVIAAAVLTVGVVLIALAGVAQRLGWLSAGHAPTVTEDAAQAGIEYTCPMHPQIRRPTPGRCPICGMPLEPVAAGAGDPRDHSAVMIDVASRRLANIQTAPVVQRPVERRIDSIGRIAIDESRQATIPAYVAGRIERLFADYTGIVVDRGDHLAVLYSPQLYAAQVEYLESLRTLDSLDAAAFAPVRRAQERLVAGSRQRLVELGMTPEQLAEMERTREARSRLTIYAPIGGTVIEKLVVEGKYVEVGEPIYRIANLSTVWLLLQLFPEDAALVRFGQRVEVEVQSLPGRTFEGRVAFVNPVVDERTRTVDVRIELSNDERLLRPGDYARAHVMVPLGEQGRVYDADLAGKWISPMHPQIVRDEPGQCPICGMDLVPTSQYGFSDAPVPQPEVLVVPRNAVLMIGSTSVVYVETTPGRFELRPVKLGPLLRDEAVIVEGVEEGEQVAVSGNFLIDSQMQLAGKPSLIDPQRAVPQAAPDEGQLRLATGAVQRIAADEGRNLEQLYTAYSALVAALAEDRVPTEAEVQTVVQVAQRVAGAESLDPALRERAASVAEESAHLHHLSLEKSREQFKGVSRNVLELAAAARGEQATAPLVHYYCSMVPGGGGDWLQTSDPPTNPYWGSRMLECVQHRELLEPAGQQPPPPQAPAAPPHRH